ncbi:hypothetical protein [Bifidobacterium callimiconis]|uniref:Uncharacterized protein n=1 Tax=Bifidobacterium callimiconis TaxID=2306973 RepID=A0A430FIJ2_9BIFI|nr:hypothetical protein [Bifidobacterium callimiconis]RSX52679.1 hypothetical protein D2E23_0407 [Bifidobacterium callimiconis]
MWKQLLDAGTRIDTLDELAPGDIVFLENEERMLAFTAATIARRNGVTWLSESGGVRRQCVGGASRWQFAFAMRDERNYR